MTITIESYAWHFESPRVGVTVPHFSVTRVDSEILMRQSFSFQHYHAEFSPA
jgi:hypothetical protein